MSSEALTRIEPHASERADSLQYLTFLLGSDLFAVPIGTIREVIEYHGLTRVPLSPPTVPGVLNLRGAVVPVVDLCVRFGRAPTATGRRTCVVVVEMPGEEGMQLVGVLVDSVSEALEVEPDQLERRPSFGTGLRADFVGGMLKVDGRFMVVLDLARVLSMDELEQIVTSSHGTRERTEVGVSREAGPLP